MEWELVKDELYQAIENYGTLPTYEMVIDMAPAKQPRLKDLITIKAIVKFRIATENFKYYACLLNDNIHKYNTIDEYLNFIFNILHEQASNINKYPSKTDLENFYSKMINKYYKIESIDFM